MVVRLSELLRTFLRSSETQAVSLSEEVRFLEQYLEIQKIRFEERLEVRIRLDPRSRNALVPTLILQPLVENAIRHGVAEQLGEGWIQIDSSSEGSRLELRVTDNGDGSAGRAKPFAPEGAGLRNTRRRLETMYRGEFALQVRGCAPSGTEALISIPFELAHSEKGKCASSGR